MFTISAIVYMSQLNLKRGGKDLRYILDLFVEWSKMDNWGENIDCMSDIYEEIISNPIDDPIYDMIVDVFDQGDTTAEDIAEAIEERNDDELSEYIEILNSL